MIIISSTTVAMVTMGISTVPMCARVLLEGDSNDGLSLELENGSENVGKDRVVSEFIDIHGTIGQIREWLLAAVCKI